MNTNAQLQGGTSAEPNLAVRSAAVRSAVRSAVRRTAPLFNAMVPLHLRDLSHSSHPADVARRRRQRAKERAALVPEPTPTPNAYPRAARGSAILSTAHGHPFYIAPQYRPPLDPESIHYHRPEPNTEPYYDWPACQCTDPAAQERIRAFGRWVRDQHYPITEPLSRTHFPVPPPSINAPAACYCLHPGLFNYDSNPWPQPDMNPQPDPDPAATTRDNPQAPPVAQASQPAGGEGFQPRPAEPNPAAPNSADPNPTARSTVEPGQIPEGHLQSADGQDLGPFPTFPPHTPIHRLPINFQRVVQDWFDKNVPLDEMAYLLDYHFHFVTSPSAISRYHTRLRQETAHREAAVLVQVVRELADEQVLGSKPDTAAAREELCTLKELQALDRDDIHAYVALRRLRLDEREAVVQERLAAVRERQIALDERLAELRLRPASAPAATTRDNPQATPAADASQSAGGERFQPRPPVPHPARRRSVRRTAGAKTCKPPQTHPAVRSTAPPASPVLNEQPHPAYHPPAGPAPAARNRHHPETDSLPPSPTTDTHLRAELPTAGGRSVSG